MALNAFQARVDQLQENGDADGLVAALAECKDRDVLMQLDLSKWDFTQSDLERIKAALPSDLQQSGAPGSDAIVENSDGVVDPSNLLETASSLKEQGNRCLQAKKLRDAAAAYEKGIETLDKADGRPIRKSDVEKVVKLKAVLYSNLAQCLLKQELFRRGMDAATKSLALDDNNAKTWYRRALCRDALKMYAEALDDVVQVESRPGIDVDELARLRKGIQDRKAARDARLKEEAPDSDDETLELVKLKNRFDEVCEKYNLKDEKTASEIADWLTRANTGEQTVVTLKDLQRRWEMDEEDAFAFLAWIDQAQKFKEEQNQAAQNFAM